MTRRFTIGFLLFIALNLLSAHLASDCGLVAVFGDDSCADDIARAGWPMRFYEEGGFTYRQSFNLLFLLIDLRIGVAFGTVSAWLLSHNKTTLPK